MREYVDQPKELFIQGAAVRDIGVSEQVLEEEKLERDSLIEDIREHLEKRKEKLERLLREELPSCSTNEWFVQTPWFGNFVDEIMRTVMLDIEEVFNE